MPFYKDFFDGLPTAADRRRCAGGLLRLKRQIRSQGVPQRLADRNLLLATWNIRELGANRKFGARSAESIQYIAEIISHFDLVAVQEVNRDLKDLQRIMRVLGSWWNYIVTDVTDGRSGNDERIAFVFDGRKVAFDHLAGEVSLPDRKGKLTRQLARSPFICAFRSGWARFSLCSVHIYYGDSSPNNSRRVKEIGDLAETLDGRAAARERSQDGEPQSVILLGDFNIFKRTDRTAQALMKQNFLVPPEILKIPSGSNLKRDKYYDQIAFHDPAKRLRGTAQAGVFNFLDAVYREADEASHQPAMESLIPKKFKGAKTADRKRRLYEQWRTYQMSDHLPLWIELQTDFSEGYIAWKGELHRDRGGVQ